MEATSRSMPDLQAGTDVAGDGAPLMLAEDVVLAALSEQQSWFLSDHLLRGDSRSATPEDAARDIADRNHLRYERIDEDTQHGYKFTRIE